MHAHMIHACHVPTCACTDSTVQSYPSHDEGDEKLVDQSGTIDSILFNISGKILMMQRERPNQFTPKEQVYIHTY